MTTPICEVLHCENQAEFRIENTGTGKRNDMCAWHKTNYTRAANSWMAVTSRIKRETT